MSKFNQTKKSTTKTVNLAGGTAYKISERDELVSGILTSFFGEQKFYGDNSNRLVELIRRAAQNDTKFLANLAVYARKKMFLRSISHVMAAELSAMAKGSSFVRQAISAVCERPDDMTEILSYYISTYGKPIPNSLKKGLADAFVRFDEYQLGKYNRKQGVQLRDVLKICHPRPINKEQSDMFGRLKDGTLAIPYTWEIEVSTKGNNAETWTDLIESKKVGYMAMLRNLRNILQANPGNKQTAFDYIANENAVRKSKQIPFRFFSAYKELEGVTMSSKALESVQKAMEISVENLPNLPGRTLIITDTSGSMNSRLSERGSVTYNDVGALMCATAHKFCDDSVVGVFGSGFATVNVTKMDSILTNVSKIKRVNVGWATNLYTAFEWMINSKEKFDRVIVFSDMQAYGSAYGYGVQKYVDTYRKTVNPNLWVHSVDLAGYGTSQFAQSNKLNLLSGWNTNILEYIIYSEAGVGSMIKDIEGFCFK